MQFTLKIEKDRKLIFFLDLALIKTNKGKMITDFDSKPYFLGRTLSFFSNHPIKNKTEIVKKVVDRTLKLSHQNFHKQNIQMCNQILFLIQYPPVFI